MTTILLIRHGQTNGNVANLAQGHTDIELNHIGHKQAEELAQRMKAKHSDVSAIYASDLKRAHQTAGKTADQLGLPISTRFSLRERHFGIAEGAPVTELQEMYGEPHWIFAPIPESETREQLLHRVRSEISQIALDHEGEKVAIFSHGLAILAFIVDCAGAQMTYLENCHVVTLTVDHNDGMPTFRFHGINEH